MIAWTSMHHLGLVASYTTPYNQLHFTKRNTKTKVTSSIWHLVNRADLKVVPSSFEVIFEVVRCVASVDSLGIWTGSCGAADRIEKVQLGESAWKKQGETQLVKLGYDVIYEATQETCWQNYSKSGKKWRAFFWGGLLPSWELTWPPPWHFCRWSASFHSWPLEPPAFAVFIGDFATTCLKAGGFPSLRLTVWKGSWSVPNVFYVPKKNVGKPLPGHRCEKLLGKDALKTSVTWKDWNQRDISTH